MRRASKKVFICGNLGTGAQTTSGQVIKTRIVSEEIVNHVGEDNCTVLNTYKRIRSLLLIYFKVLPSLYRYRNAVFFPAQRGVTLLIPAFYIAKHLFRIKLHYIVIGGWLPLLVKHKPILRHMIKKIDCVYVETKTMEKALLEQGFSNAIIMPNVKKLNIISSDNIKPQFKPPYRLCTFSRVMKQKGIEEIVRAVVEINQARGETVFELDIYGKVETEENAWFDQLEKGFPAYCHYKGIVAPDKSTDVIKEYFLLVFPTLFFTEGIPGTIIDAYASGVPVLSSKWESFSDIVDEGITGFGYEFGNYQMLKDVLDYFSLNPSKVNDLKSNCLKKATCYLSDNVMNYLRLA